MECAADQRNAAFWDIHDEFLVEQSSRASRDQLVSLAGDLGLDSDAFAQCLDSDTHLQTVRDKINAARRIGVSYGPIVLVNGQNAGTTLAGIRVAVAAAAQ